MKKSSTVVLSLIMIGFSLIAMPTSANAEPNGYYGEENGYYGEENGYYGEENGYYGDSKKFLDLKNAKIGIKDDVIKDDVIKKIFFETRGKIPEDGSEGAFGYGVVLADGKVIATTTHAGLLDSEDQMGDIYSPVFHNHYVQLVEQDPEVDFPLCKSGLAIGDLTFESPGVVDIVANKAILSHLPESANELLFDTADEITPGSDIQVVASFKLQPLIDLVNKNPLVTVCVEDVKPTEDVFVFEIDGFAGENHYYNKHPRF